MACAYILYSRSKKKYYTGSSRERDAQTRMQSHNHGYSESTKSGRPWVLVDVEQFETYTEARKRELFLKTGQGRKWMHEQYDKVWKAD